MVGLQIYLSEETIEGQATHEVVASGSRFLCGSHLHTPISPSPSSSFSHSLGKAREEKEVQMRRERWATVSKMPQPVTLFYASSSALSHLPFLGRRRSKLAHQISGSLNKGILYLLPMSREKQNKNPVELSHSILFSIEANKVLMRKLAIMSGTLPSRLASTHTPPLNL